MYNKQNKYSNIMIDLETLGIDVDSCILSIGAIKFNPNYKLLPIENMNTFYRKIDIKSCTELKLKIDPNVEKWWTTQPKHIYDDLFSDDNRTEIKQALIELSEWFNKDNNPDFTIVYANGPNFDISILDYVYKKCGLNSPWKYYNVRCCRTIYDLGKFKLSYLPSNNKHHSLYDCYSQIIGIYQSLINIGIIK